ncbi:calcium-binding and coiled-coil domain-containing protein 2 [Microtus pennsylvanicus]|uniref:calcium-binding and coiled-coil domain-containing protein 2 n=1 Tax=Microtus pennsylvanicus TaxID=10058 RepID=UPI003F6B9F59
MTVVTLWAGPSRPLALYSPVRVFPATYCCCDAAGYWLLYLAHIGLSTMENMMEDSFISTVLPGCGGSSQVVFNGVEDFYLPGGDVTCRYSFTRQFNPRHSDWIGIFKVGWETIKDYYTYVWVPMPSPEELTTQQEVLFKAYYLPKDGENYQFCYVDEDGKVQGASTPFQFCSKSEEDMLVVTTQGKVEEMEQRTEELLRENQELKENCASLRQQKSDVRAELEREQGKVEEMKQRTKKLLRENQELKDNCAVLQGPKPNSDKQAELQEKGKEEEMGQRIEKLLGENKHLKEMCALLRQQKSETQAELRRGQAEQAQLAQQNKELVVKNQATSDTTRHQRSKIGELLQRLAIEQKKVQEMKQRIEKVLRENQQLKYRCASLPKPNSDEDTQAELQSEQVQMLARGELGACTGGCGVSDPLSPGCPGLTRDQAGLVHRDSPGSASQVLKLN